MMSRPAACRTILALYLAAHAVMLADLAAWLHLRREFWRADAARESAAAARESAAGLLGAVVDAETGQRGYLLTGRDAYLADYDRGRAACRDHADALGPDVRAAVAAKLAELAETVERVRRGDKPGAYTVVNSDRGKRLTDALRLAVAGRTAELDVAAAAARQVQLARADDALLLIPSDRLLASAFMTATLLVALAATRGRAVR